MLFQRKYPRSLTFEGVWTVMIVEHLKNLDEGEIDKLLTHNDPEVFQMYLSQSPN